MSVASNGSTSLDLYQTVTNRIIELLEQGTIPWKKPWKDVGIPSNLLSKRPYRGINLWLLLSLGYEKNLFLTWDQLKKLGGSVRQGEHGHVVVFWKVRNNGSDLEDEGSRSQVPLLRYYKVFNIDQCRDLPQKFLPDAATDAATISPLAQCELVVAHMRACPEIRHEQQRAFYEVTNDYVNMPNRDSFVSSEAYYQTLFHELIHSTGHEKRLARTTLTQMAEFGSDMYSIEELIAEMGAAYLSSHASILAPQIDNVAAYVGGWLAQLRNDKKFIIRAAGNAQKAADYILNVSSEEPKETIEQAELLSDSE